MKQWRKCFICVVIVGCMLLFSFRERFGCSSRAVEPPRKTPTPTPTPFLTLFTSWKTFPERYHVFNNTLRLWPLLQPHGVKLILFTNDLIPGLNEYEKLGWTVLPIKRQIEGCVVMKDLVLRAMQLQPNSKLYAFVNGDMLLTYSFIENLIEIMKSPLLVNRTYMVTGRKTKIANITREEASSWKNIERAAKRGVLDNEMWGIDYIVTPPNYHWQLVPDFQLWRPVYDNWLIWDARRMGHVAIDATDTLLAPHQNAPFPKDRENGKVYNNVNYFKVSRETLYLKGTIPCCEYHTVYVNHTITLQRRKQIPERCKL